jgi:hypothetical protein
MRLTLVIGEGRVHASATKRAGIAWAADAAYDGPADLARVLSMLAAEAPPRARRVHVVIADGLARVKTLDTLPRLRRPELASHVQLHSRRYFLQNGIPLVTDAVPLATAKGEAARALLGAIPEPLAQAIVDGIDAAGLDCETIVPEGSSDLSLVPHGARARRLARMRQSLRRWAIGAAGTLILSALLHVGLLLGRRRSADRELLAMKGGIDAALAVRRDGSDAAAALAAIAAAEANTPRRARFLANLTRAMPDSAFVVTLRLDAAGNGMIAGYAPRAAAVVARLERSGLAHGAAIEGTVTREVVGGVERERFTVRFHTASAAEPPR